MSNLKEMSLYFMAAALLLQIPIGEAKANSQNDSDKSMEEISSYSDYEWVRKNGDWYFENRAGNQTVGWLEIDGNWYFFEHASGKMKTGWLKSNGNWYYLKSSGAMAIGWSKINGSWYYLTSSGAMRTGWLENDDNWYFLNSDGSMVTGWKKMNNSWYYLSDNGEMEIGWIKVGGNWYYLSNNGEMISANWWKVGNQWYYFEENGVMKTGWLQQKQNWYYLTNSGSMAIGWEKVNGNWYYLTNSGAMRTGWINIDRNWYYMTSSGSMATGWTKLNEKWYYLNKSGLMQTGWLKLGEDWYYLNSNGAMQTDSIIISGKNYLFNSSGVWITKTNLHTTDLLLPQKNSEERITPITHVVIHFTSNAAQKPNNPYNVSDIYNIFRDYGVSAHYMIGRDGEIYFMVSENRVAYHAGEGKLLNYPHYTDRLNQYSVGIELMAIGTKSEMNSMISSHTYSLIPKSYIGYTEAQYKALNRLLNDIIERNPTVTRDRKHIIGHDEYAPGRKTDPGSLFNWSKVGF